MSKYHLSRIVSVVMAIVLAMSVCVFADSTFTKEEYLASMPQIVGPNNARFDEELGRLKGTFTNTNPYNEDMAIGVYGGGVVGVEQRPHTAMGIIRLKADWAKVQTLRVVAQTVNEVTPIYGCTVDAQNYIYPTDEEISIGFDITNNSSAGNTGWNSLWNFLQFNNRFNNTVTIEYEFVQLYVDDVLIRSFEEPSASEPRYYSYRIPFGTRVHFDIVGGRTAQVNVNTPTREGNYLSKPDFNSIKWSFTGGAGTKAEWYSMIPVELEGYGDKSLLGGYSKFRSEWVTTGDTMNVCYYATSSNVKSDYYVTVTIYAEAVRPVWYGAQTQTELSSGDLTAITNTGGAVTYASGNGSQSSPYIVQPTNNDGITINYGSIDYGVQNEADGIISGLVNSLKSLLGAPVDSMNEVITDGQGFFSAVSGMFEWLPVEVRTPIIGALSTVVVIGVIKVLL